MIITKQTANHSIEKKIATFSVKADQIISGYTKIEDQIIQFQDTQKLQNTLL